MSAYWNISEVQVVEDYAIRVRFVDGLEGIVRFLPGFFRGVFTHLIHPAEFKKATVFDGAVTWPGGLDLAPDAMYDEIKSQGEWVVGG